MTLHVFHDTSSRFRYYFLRSSKFFREHDYLSVASSFIATVPFNHIEVLYHVKTNGPCLHTSFMRGRKCNVRPRLNKGAAFEGAVFAARTCRHFYSSSPSRLELFNL